MRWTKIKNIIILLLLIVNLALLALVGVRTWRSAQNVRLARERMVTILENNNIEFLPQEVPDALELSPLRLTVTPPGEDQARILVGELSGVETAGSRTVCTGAEGVATLLLTGEVEVQYAAPGLAGPAVRERLSQLGVELRETAREPQEDGAVLVTCIQLRQGVPLPGERVTLTLREEAVSALSFRLLSGDWETDPARENVTASTALLRFLEAMNRGGYVCSQVTSLYPGYAVSGSGTLTLTPAWYVETDTRPWIFAVDGPTGAVTPGE